MQINYPEIVKSDIRIDPEIILKLLGEQQGAVDAYSADLVHQYMEECLGISSPKGAFILQEVLEADSSAEISISGMAFTTGKIIPKMLRGSERYAFLLASAGPEPEDLARKLLEEGNYLEGYIADLVASYIVEQVADLVEEEIRKLAKKSELKITNRYSPGYCSWNVSEQQKLFRLFPEQCCGITLSASSLMTPVKSVSAIIGLGKQVEYRNYTCDICSLKDCKFRKVKPA